MLLCNHTINKPWVLTVALLQHVLGVFEKIDKGRVGLEHIGRVLEHQAADAHLLAPVRLRVAQLLQHSPVGHAQCSDYFSSTWVVYYETITSWTKAEIKKADEETDRGFVARVWLLWSSLEQGPSRQTRSGHRNALNANVIPGPYPLDEWRSTPRVLVSKSLDIQRMALLQSHNTATASKTRRPCIILNFGRLIAYHQLNKE